MINCKRKGNTFELEMVNALKKHFPEVSRNWMEQSDPKFRCADFEKGKKGSIAPDIYFRGVYIQCKKGSGKGEAGKPIQTFLEYEQRAEKYGKKVGMPNLLVALVWRVDRAHTYAMMRGWHRYCVMLTIPITSGHDDLVAIPFDQFVEDLKVMFEKEKR